ncbi:nitrous oxide reductase accessory protein NosL [Inhella sp.]|uniref:nitrous oxide reductase accessory protein NosL n=1 Tax=Inhella sp. TaxID=1921806 RepID=UPI0035B029F0
MRRRLLAVAALGGLGVLAARAWPSRAPAALPDLGAELCVSAPPFPYDPASGLAADAPRPVPSEARCPVCGMYPARAPRWAAQAHFDDGAALFFDSPLMLMLWLQSVPRYSPGRRADELHALWVQDHLSGEWLPAQAAHYVAGSGALGPMRNGNLPPFASATAAQAFARQRGGLVLGFEAARAPERLRALDTRSHRHAA